ncbi:MAG: ParB/RepB/Spo0J family partition protein [Candidatus Acididesulfobacter guangdongensis]|uniref:ParB/RepB/Spo0J family partition protein n=1 Tax=Acididesulfobacter guangdongensis TaxID=2597225 RepID=A0A519BHG5_ACIG2|nr:MAG: ParB/RepB/Spo0J family partition protein [Candidatus Acididesulfobacter guangdongensis]
MKKLNDPLDWIGKDTEDKASVIDINIDEIIVNEQIRNKENVLKDIDELTESIKEFGVNQNLLVMRNNNKDNEYFLIAGERRLEASKRAGLNSVPCLVKNIKEEDILIYQLLENIQRKDLSKPELANVYKQLKEKGLTIRQIAEKIHKSKSYVQEILSICEMPEELKEKITGSTIKKAIEISKIKDEQEKKKLIKNYDSITAGEVKNKRNNLDTNKEENNINLNKDNKEEWGNYKERDQRFNKAVKENYSIIQTDIDHFNDTHTDIKIDIRFDIIDSYFGTDNIVAIYAKDNATASKFIKYLNKFKIKGDE